MAIGEMSGADLARPRRGLASLVQDHA